MKKLNYLLDTLGAYEATNTFAHLDFLMRSKILNYVSQLGQSLPGTELSEKGVLVKHISQYANLRKVLSEGKAFNPLPFLPQVPDALKSKMTPQQYLLTGRGETTFLFPDLISRWLGGGRRVYEFNNSDVELMSPLDKNYLGFLPKGHYIVELQNPVFAEWVALEVDPSLFFKHMIISNTDDNLQLFFIPGNIHERCLSEDFRKEFSNLVSLLGKKEINTNIVRKILERILPEGERTQRIPSLFNVMSLSVSKGIAYGVNTESVSFVEVDFVQILKDKCKVQSDEELYAFLKEKNHVSMIAFVLNGLGRLIAEFTPAGVLHPVTANEDISIEADAKPVVKKTHPQSATKFEWYEVPENKVVRIVSRDKVLKGFQKGFHIRREVTRHYPARGIKAAYTVIIPEVVIHPELAAPGQIPSHLMTDLLQKKIDQRKARLFK